MKSKLIRLFAVVASVLVLAVALVVPMSADSFDSSRPLVEDAWEYITVIDIRDSSNIDSLNFYYENPCYVIFEVNGDRYSISSLVAGYNGDDLVFGRYGTQIDDYPLLTLDLSSGNLVGTNAAGTVVFSRTYSPFTSLSIIVYSNASLGLSSVSGITVNESIVVPTTNRITSVFTNLMDWITDGLNSVQGVFYANNQLTMLGTLAVIGVAIAVAFLLIGVLQRFLHLRG